MIGTISIFHYVTLGDTVEEKGTLTELLLVLLERTACCNISDGSDGVSRSSSLKNYTS